ncbi:MAG TPA: GNAT family N-acetyltransferase, partial [Candidatus Lustribacter sp.]|nr:GNAT family N-acetyltransferase [Candidatus Lustribacter sp.]
NPCGGVSEVVGVAVLPSWRRRGVAAALTATLTRDALERGIATVFCSAQSEQVARVYEGIGFRRIGTAALAEHT